MTRMIMQEQTLYNPVFGDPEDPKFGDITSKHFETVDVETLEYYGGWVDMKEDGTVVRHGDVKPDETDSSKLDDALQSLRGGTSAPPKPDAASYETVEAPETVEEVEDEPEAAPEPPSPPVRQEEASKPVKRRERAQNTEVPRGGIILGPSQPKPRPSALITKKDPWAINPDTAPKRGKNGKLTVRVSDGKVLKDE